MTKRRLTNQQARRIQVQRTSSGKETSEAAQAGLVIAHYGKRALIEKSDGDRLLCHLRAHLQPPVAGDEVLWIPAEYGGVVDALVTRRNVLQKPDSQGRLRPVAANIDIMLIVFAPEPAPQAYLIDRYLVAAECLGVEAVLTLNKADLLDASDELITELARYKKLGYRTLTTHQKLPDARDLTTIIGNNTLVLVGQSGVGKSSLIQRLLPDASIRVGALSEVANKGRHTTTTAELFHLPGGGRLIDSPGVRDFRLSHVTPEMVASGFREFSAFAGQCRFRDCQHQSEPGCAITAAVKDGKISSKRFESFKQIVAKGENQ